MIRVILTLALLALATPSHAATQIQGVVGGIPLSIVPPTLIGQAVFTASTSSAAINASLSLAPNSSAFPVGVIMGGTIRIKVQAVAVAGIYVCWQGGTCTSSVGEYIAPGESQTRSLPTQNMTTTPPTVISTGTPAVEVEW